MLAKKKVLFFTGRKISNEELEFGRAINAQFRNAHIAAQNFPESADYVAGQVPENYSDYPTYPEEAAEMIAGSAALVNGGTPEGTEGEDDSGSSEGNSGDENQDDDDEEVEITLEILEKMDKDELVELAGEYEDFNFNAQEKKSAPKMREALANYLDIQE